MNLWGMWIIPASKDAVLGCIRGFFVDDDGLQEAILS